ncbi:hypothetical protein HNY73_005083 [Argiope bruennichi]|uniref:THAP-type domain-containing protein n=1 Tax=Argiope bruennichi TaxID=94029 RepID=A0A8T0FMI9_ARGBR|nr:hypothetical protein HNY73_005083 [Argiope bruennichi]
MSSPRYGKQIQHFVAASDTKASLRYKLLKVCERHFKDGEVLYRTTFYNESTGKTLSTPLKKPRLKENDVPSIFPDCATYLSSSTSQFERVLQKRGND